MPSSFGGLFGFSLSRLLFIYFFIILLKNRPFLSSSLLFFQNGSL